jgi:predicted nucleic acid-binding protein
MALVLYDSNILIDALKGYAEALDELAHWDGPAISAITWMEVNAGAKPDEVPKLDAFFQDFGFEIIHTNDRIMTGAAKLRGDSIRNGPKILLPDAIILATAIAENLTLITRNTRDFKGPNVRVPYELVTNSAGSVEVVNVAPKVLAPHATKSATSPILTWTAAGWKPLESRRKRTFIAREVIYTILPLKS